MPEDELSQLKDKIKTLRVELSSSTNTRENFLIALRSSIINIDPSGIVTGERNTYQLFGKRIQGTHISDHFEGVLASEYFDSFKKNRKEMEKCAAAAQGEWKTVFDSADHGTGFLTWNSFPDSLGWEVHNNKANSVSVNDNIGHYLISDRELVGPDDDYLITYRAAAKTEPQDLSIIVGGRQAMDLKQGPMILPEDQGYCFGFGSHGNSVTVLQRKRRPMCYSNALPVKGKRYNFTAERIGGRIRFYVDDNLIYEFTDALPLMGKEHGYVSIYTCGEGHIFSDIKVCIRPTCLSPDFRKNLGKNKRPIFQFSRGMDLYVEAQYIGTTPLEKNDTFIIKDVSDLVQARKKTGDESHEKERYKNALLSIGHGVITTDTEGVIHIMNKTAEEFTCTDLNSAQGCKLDEIYNVKEKENGTLQKNRIDKTIKGEETHTSANMILTASDGTEHLISECIAPIKDKNGNITGAVLIFRETE